MDKNKLEIFSNNLRYYMKIKGITRQELADKTKISYFSIRDYEKGVCYAKKDKLKLIADELDISPLMLTEEHNVDKIMNIVDNSVDNEIMLNIMIKLSKLSLEGKKHILQTINMIDSLKQ